MGSSGWSYYTPYKEDIAQVLQDLRQREFEGGDYQKFWLFEEVSDEIFDELDELEERDWHQSNQKLVEALAHILERKHIHAELPQAPQTIDELLERNGPDGTHSILDIDHIASQPELGAAIPFPEAKLLEYFGTDRPTRAMVEKMDAGYALSGFLERWQAIFIIIYQDGYPSEIYFTGHSGG
jgi:hypothetical protein